MRQLRLAIRILIFAMILNGVSQALITYAVVPDKYDDRVYDAEEVRKIAYAERAAGIRFLYNTSAVNSVIFAVLGTLVAVEMWVTNRIEFSARREASELAAEAVATSDLLHQWPIVVAAIFAGFSLISFCG